MVISYHLLFIVYHDVVFDEKSFDIRHIRVSNYVIQLTANEKNNIVTQLKISINNRPIF